MLQHLVLLTSTRTVAGVVEERQHRALLLRKRPGELHRHRRTAFPAPAARVGRHDDEAAGHLLDGGGGVVVGKGEVDEPGAGDVGLGLFQWFVVSIVGGSA